MTLPLRRRTIGFSLLELLAVLAILALLTALLFPVFSASRRRASEAVCASNLQQISHALSLYAADYDGNYPQITDAVFIQGVADHSETNIPWRGRLASYLAVPAFPFCPARQWINGVDAETNSGDFSGYALNGRLNSGIARLGPSTLHGIHEARLRYPALSIVVAEARAGILGLIQPDIATEETRIQQYSDYYEALLPSIREQLPGALRHHGGANYAFADGHVTWLQPTQIAITPQSDGMTLGFGL